MSSLADFYGIASSAPEEATVDDAAVAAAEAKKARESKVALESEQFDSQSYLSSLLSRKSMRDLIQHDNAMISQKRALDSEMQTLVYDNYNKFISATDMIRKMKSNVESMEQQMAHLLTNMNDISRNCQGIEASLTPNRAKVENLLGTGRLLKRLEFLFELPEKLRTSLRLGAYEQAVRYFKTSSAILDQYKHHASFAHIRRECDTIIADLKSKLRALIRDPTLSSEDQMSYTAMLVLDLAEPDSDELMKQLVEQQRKKMQAQMHKAVDIVGRAATSRRSSMTPAQEQKAKEASDLSSSEELSPSATTTTAANDTNLLALLHQHFITPYIVFADTFLATLVRPYEAKQRKLRAALDDMALQENAKSAANSKTNGPSVASSIESATATLAHLTRAIQLSQSALTDLSVELFDEYFTLSRRALIQRAVIGPNADASQVVLQFTATLKTFYDGLTKAVHLLPGARLTDRAQEIVQHALTHCVEVVCDHALHQCVSKLADAHGQVLAWRPAAGGALVSPATVSLRLRQVVEECLNLLVVVLSTREYLPEAVSAGLSFVEMARAHATQLIGQIAKEIAYRTPRRADGPVYDPPQPTALSRAIDERLAKRGAGVGSERDARTPLFYLFLSQLASAQETKDIPSILRTLGKFFPPTHVRGGHRGQQDELAITNLMTKSRESAQALLLRYCETHGFKVTDIVRTYLVSKGASGEPRHPSELVDRLQQQLHRISLELNMIFPKSDAVHDRNHDASGRDLLGVASRTSAVAAVRSHIGKEHKTARGGVGGGINRDIQRLFTQKISTFGDVDVDGAAQSEVRPDRTQPMWAVCKIAFKAMMEAVRMERLSASEYRQLQLDVFTLRHELPSFLPEATVDVCQVLFVLLDETSNSALERATNATPSEEYALAETYDASRAQRPPVRDATEETTKEASEDGGAISGGAASFYSSVAVAAPSTQPQPTGALARLVLSSPTGDAQARRPSGGL